MHTLLALCHHLNGCSWVSSPAFFNSLSSTLTRAMLQLVLFSWFCHCFSGLKTWTDPFCGGLACDPTPLGWEFPYGGLGVDPSSSIPRCGDWSGCYYPIAGELLSGRCTGGPHWNCHSMVSSPSGEDGFIGQQTIVWHWIHFKAAPMLLGLWLLNWSHFLNSKTSPMFPFHTLFS